MAYGPSDWENNRKKFLEWREQVLEEKIERFISGDKNAEQLEQEERDGFNRLRQRVLGFDKIRWMDFERKGFTTPLTEEMQQKAREWCEFQYRSSKPNNFEDIREYQEVLFDLLNTTVGDYKALDKPKVASERNVSQIKYDTAKTILNQAFERADLQGSITDDDLRLLPVISQGLDNGSKVRLVNELADQFNLDNTSRGKMREALHIESSVVNGWTTP
tara:strand:- start:464 stop:1117 length:654 start_codon:yes stop_codon:yes gene_type:complete